MGKITVKYDVKHETDQLIAQAVEQRVETLDSPLRFTVTGGGGSYKIEFDPAGTYPVVFLLIQVADIPFQPAPPPVPDNRTAQQKEDDKKAEEKKFKAWDDDDLKKHVTYKLGDDSKPDPGQGKPGVKKPDPGDASGYELDQPHLLVGKGAVKLLGERPTAFHFQNPKRKSVLVTIHIGRAALQANLARGEAADDDESGAVYVASEGRGGADRAEVV